MSTLPEPPSHLLTIAEYAALGEVETGYTELVEGRLLMSPSPAPRHNRASGRLFTQLDQQLPEDLDIVQDVDLDLELVAPNQPGFSRRPDLVIVRKDALDRVDREGGLLRASETVVVMEIVSPGSRRTDYHVKRSEYADANIPHYWIVDLADPVTLTACHRTEEFGYLDSGTFTGAFTTTEPFAVRLDLDRLR
ncbi:Endonuclease, Uma2 family (restriction endonuclease fold) [Amycolatopsis arida]|uniref:Endonuclease, Uma2 family (Restriction endonuclease fold) n=1 Tax=Amycolatopsis arida TaxID=587909 RepID=A0A1I5P701_9PSEU|nr:Uma2 family endonuclease [Amycolatopsis arida]TDX98366.1 Uma2 family endonuclease [Amycolatopsis arida]SFP29246.1 Endonuclease, Uma2 family (restriction endonuclease fold) [Amycolatopsis arida]